MVDQVKITTVNEDDIALSKELCAMCRRQFSRYTCPTCNAPYCSLVCFRSEFHGQCSESFYWKEVEVDIRSTPSKTAEERIKMMEMLKRLEEDALKEGDLLDEEIDEGEEDLARRLGTLDLENSTSESLWAALTPAEREKFLRALDDPSSKLTQDLMANGELEKGRIEPWWEDSISHDVSQETGGKRYGSRPMPMDIPQTMIQEGVSTLLYNLCAVCIAYAYVTRRLSISPLFTAASNDLDREEARNIFETVVPFIVENNSKLVFSSLESVVVSVWSRFAPGEMTRDVFAVLLNDASTLIRPPSVSEIQEHPFNRSTMAPLIPNQHTTLIFSDLVNLFSRQKRVVRKLTFYAAQVAGALPDVMKMIAVELLLQSEKMKGEEDLDISAVEGRVQRDRVRKIDEIP